jgi:hypothetical protein
MGQLQPRKTTNLARLYDEQLMPWSRATEALGTGSLGPEPPCFLGTVRPDGRPHSAGVGVVVHDGDLFFTSGPASRKTRNLAANSACTLSMRLEGIDLVLEGNASRETDLATLTAVAAYEAGGWPARADGDAISAPYSAQDPGHGSCSGFESAQRSASVCGRYTVRVGGTSKPATAGPLRPRQIPPRSTCGSSSTADHTSGLSPTGQSRQRCPSRQATEVEGRASAEGAPHDESGSMTRQEAFPPVRQIRGPASRLSGVR